MIPCDPGTIIFLLTRDSSPILFLEKLPWVASETLITPIDLWSEGQLGIIYRFRIIETVIILGVNKIEKVVSVCVAETIPAYLYPKERQSPRIVLHRQDLLPKQIFYQVRRGSNWRPTFQILDCDQD